MAATKTKGDLAEMKVAADVLARGYKIAFPFGEDWSYDLIVLRNERLERVQIKHCRSDGSIVEVRAIALTIVAGKVRAVHRYTAADIDWLAAWDPETDQCMYIPASELGDGRHSITLRLVPARNGQQRGIRMLSDYLEF